MKTKTEISKVIEDLKILFDIKEFKPSKKNASYETDGKFYIDKRVCERFQVIDKLKEYFTDKIIDGGYLEVDGITFVFTTFEVKEGRP